MRMRSLFSEIKITAAFELFVLWFKKKKSISEEVFLQSIWHLH